MAVNRIFADQLMSAKKHIFETLPLLCNTTIFPPNRELSREITLLVFQSFQILFPSLGNLYVKIVAFNSTTHAHI